MGKKALAAFVVVVLLAACGSARRDRPRLTQAAFLAAANQICVEATTRTGRLVRLRALRPPKTAVDLYGRWLRAEKDALLAATPADATTKTQSELEPGIALAIAEGKIAGYARRLGAEACAERAMGTIRP